MAIKDVELNVATFLDSVGTLDLALGTNLFAGPEPEIEGVTASPTVSCLHTGGPEPIPYLNGNRESYHRPDVSIHVRGDPADYGAGRTLAAAVWEAVHLPALAGALDGYTLVLPKDSGPVYLGRDEAQRHRWVIRLRCEYKAGTA